MVCSPKKSHGLHSERPTKPAALSFRHSGPFPEKMIHPTKWRKSWCSSILGKSSDVLVMKKHLSEPIFHVFVEFKLTVMN